MSLASDQTTSSQSSRLLSLPAEIRRQIYAEVFALNPKPKISLSILYNRPNVIGSLPHLPLLETCRQIYSEARLIPFESNCFQFYRWYGSSSMECRKFLAKLAPWQVEAIRDIQLGITECEIRGLGMKGASDAFAEICELLGKGLRSLTLDVEPHAVVWSNASAYPEEARNVWWGGKDAMWIKYGLARLKSLGMLHIKTFDQSIMVASGEVEDGRADYEQTLSAELPWCGRVSVCLQKDKAKGGGACDVCAC
jgi:hypothetical protein